MSDPEAAAVVAAVAAAAATAGPREQPPPARGAERSPDAGSPLPRSVRSDRSRAARRCWRPDRPPRRCWDGAAPLFVDVIENVAARHRFGRLDVLAMDLLEGRVG